MNDFLETRRRTAQQASCCCATLVASNRAIRLSWVPAAQEALTERFHNNHCCQELQVFDWSARLLPLCPVYTHSGPYMAVVGRSVVASLLDSDCFICDNGPHRSVRVGLPRHPQRKIMFMNLMRTANSEQRIVRCSALFCLCFVARIRLPQTS